MTASDRLHVGIAYRADIAVLADRSVSLDLVPVQRRWMSVQLSDTPVAEQTLSHREPYIRKFVIDATD